MVIIYHAVYKCTVVGTVEVVVSADYADKAQLEHIKFCRKAGRVFPDVCTNEIESKGKEGQPVVRCQRQEQIEKGRADGEKNQHQNKLLLALFIQIPEKSIEEGSQQCQSDIHTYIPAIWDSAVAEQIL